MSAILFRDYEHPSHCLTMAEESIKKRNKRFCNRCHSRNFIIQCKCGYCNETLTKYDKWGHERHFKKSHQNNGRHLSVSEESRRKRSISLTGLIGEKSRGWKGNKVGYDGLHRWIRKHFPKPEDGLCQLCHEKPLKEAANISGIYNREFNNWAWFCRHCHKKYDNIATRCWITRRKKEDK